MLVSNNVRRIASLVPMQKRVRVAGLALALAMMVAGPVVFGGCSADDNGGNLPEVNQDTLQTLAPKCRPACGANRICVNRQCVIGCSSGQSLCADGDGGAGSCVDLQASNTNCGTCGHVCASGTACSAGQCVVSCGSLTSCNDGDGGLVCANLQTSNTNCGACGVRCTGGQVCVAGRCSIGSDGG
jgi:hypothetical protein